LLAIGAMGAVLWLRSPHKLAMAVPLVVVGLALLAFMPENWVARMQTIQNYEEDGSAMGRIQAWQTMTGIANSRITGAGFSAYSTSIFNTYSPGEWPARAAHSIYFQVLGEHGWIGLFLFLAIWVIAWRMASRIRKQARSVGGQAQALGVLAGMCQVSIVGYAVGGAFLSLAYFDLPYNILIMLLVATRVLSQMEQAEGASQVAPERGVGSPRSRRDSVFGPAQTTRTRAAGSSASAASRRA
jgi:probable O-glycosylation ligase (exosortase A-associated)